MLNICKWIVELRKDVKSGESQERLIRMDPGIRVFKCKVGPENLGCFPWANREKLCHQWMVQDQEKQIQSNEQKTTLGIYFFINREWHSPCDDDGSRNTQSCQSDKWSGEKQESGTDSTVCSEPTWIQWDEWSLLIHNDTMTGILRNAGHKKPWRKVTLWWFLLNEFCTICIPPFVWLY